MDLRDCIAKRLIVKEDIDSGMITTEINESRKDLSWAKKMLEMDGTKEAIEKSYYAMFHIAKALLFSKGYREKGSHICVLAFLEELEKDGKIKFSLVSDYRAAMKDREAATYHSTYSNEIAKESIETAKEFIDTIEKLIKL